ncbi:MAG: prolyl oligopeptidase family serine peptidase, partial [Bacteroidales bacterium]
MKKHIILLFLGLLLGVKNEIQATVEMDSLAITHFLVAGPIPLVSPAFDTLNNVKGEKFTSVQWLSFPMIDVDKVNAEVNTSFAWNGNTYTWNQKEIQIVNTHRGIRIPSKNEKNTQCAFLLTYLQSTRYQKITLNIESRQTYAVYMDGKLIFDKKNVEVDSILMPRNKKEITLEPGFHTLFIKTLFPVNTQDPWMLNAWIAYPKSNANSLKTSLSSTHAFDLANYLYGERLSNALLSYDGQYYALTHSKTDKDKLTTESWVEIRNTQTNRLEKILKGLTSFSFAKHAPLYAYRQTKGSETSLYIGDLIHNTEEKIYETTEKLAYTLAWDPQGKYLIFSTSEEGDNPTNGLRKFASLTDRWPYWRTRSLLQKIDINSKVVLPLTHGYVSTNLEDIRKDGNEILFSINKDCDSVRPYSKQSMYTMSLTDNHVELLWEDYFAGNALFSPDGKQLVVLGSAAMFNELGKATQAPIVNDYDIQAYLFDINTKKAKPISLNFNPNIVSAKWDVSGKSIWFNVEDKDSTKLFVYDLATQKYTNIPLEVENLQSFDLANTQATLIYSGSSASESSRAYLVKNGKKSNWAQGSYQTQLLAHPQKAELANVKIGKHKNWQFINKSGISIEATYYLPVDFDSLKKYPTIVYYYGGTTPTPRSFEVRYPKNVWASKGYIVLVLQPSGATGFGQDFAAEHVNNWGITVADEIISGTRQFCKEFAFVDSTKLGCIGASYGGFMTQLIVTQTSLFAAAISHAGISSISS